MACSIQDGGPPPPQWKRRPPARASLGARARASNLLTAGACAARSWVARRMRLRVAEPSLLVRASGAPSSSRVTACGRERTHGITHRSCANNPVLSAVLYPWNSTIKRASAHPSAPQPRPLHHTAPQTDGTGNWRLICGDIWPGLFPDIYRFGRTSILAFLFAHRVLFTPLVLCEREPPPSASAERFFVRARTGLQIRAPSVRHDAGVFEAHSLKLARVHDRVSPGRQVARPTFTPRSDKRSHFEAGGRRKARAPAEYTTARPRASKRVEATRVGGPELVHSAVEGMRGRDRVQRGRAPPARGPRRPTSPRT